MKFVGVSSSEQARRGYWRVVLAGDVLDLGFFFSNPLEKWPAKVERWRAAVDAGNAGVPALTSTASISGDSTALLNARAVVDVFILGADMGDSVGAVARRMGNLISNVDVASVEKIDNADPVARDAAVQDAAASSDPLGIGRAASAIETVVKIAAIVALVYVVAKLVEASK